MCSLISTLSGFIEEKPSGEEAVSTMNLVEKIEQHIRKISEGLKGNSAMEVIFRNDLECENCYYFIKISAQ